MKHTPGPLRKAPAYYIGKTWSHYSTVHPETELYDNGALPGVRNKAARRMLRKAFGKTCSHIEQKILKALDLRTEVQRLATNSHEAQRYLDKTIALHQPVVQTVRRTELRELNTNLKRSEKKKNFETEQYLRIEQMTLKRKAEAEAKTLRSTLTQTQTKGIAPHDEGTPRRPLVRVNGEVVMWL